jgi:hypothetical protein
VFNRSAIYGDKKVVVSVRFRRRFIRVRNRARPTKSSPSVQYLLMNVSSVVGGRHQGGVREWTHNQRHALGTIG